MKYIELTTTDAYTNLATEEYVFTCLDPQEEYFMLWQNDNALLIGKHQNTVEEINQAFVDENHIAVVRRLTGGGTVYHDKGNLNFTFIVHQQRADTFSFHVFVEPVLSVLHQLGIPAQFSGRNDLTIGGMKFAGNAQYAKHGRVLAHGCMMLDANVDYLSQALQVKKAKYESRGIKSVQSRVTYINKHLDTPLAMSQFKTLLREAVFLKNNIEPYELTDADKAAIQELRDKKYATWEWNYGISPAYNMKREKKFPSGLVTVYMQVAKGYIQEIHFYGDFFGNEDMGELEKQIQGTAVNETLLPVLRSLSVEKYMNGITADDIYQLIVYE